MKNLIITLFLVGSIALIITSCAKDEEADDSSSSSESAGTGTTASGTIEGNSDLSGTFSMSAGGATPSGGCIDNSAYISAFNFPSETKGFKNQFIITSPTTFTKSLSTYSDTSCSTITSFFNTMSKSATIGAEVTNLTAGSDPAKPTSADKISYIDEKYALKANTTAMVEHYANNFNITLTAGTELAVNESSPSTKYNIIATGTMTGSSKTWLFFDAGRSVDNYTDWSSDLSVYWK
tara:strand:- start:351 stop:1058 length:708 start_codon:yes stop_codon:yes gene_type:complete